MGEWLFAKGPGGWPVHLVYVLEGLYWALTIVLCALMPWSRKFRSTLPFDLFAILGGISCGLAIIWPIAVAPFFFGAKGEAMLATLPLSLLALPFVIGLCIVSFRKVS